MTHALARPGAGPMTMGARTMSGFVEVTGDVLEDDEALLDWIELGPQLRRNPARQVALRPAPCRTPAPR